MTRTTTVTTMTTTVPTRTYDCHHEDRRLLPRRGLRLSPRGPLRLSPRGPTTATTSWAYDSSHNDEDIRLSPQRGPTVATTRTYDGHHVDDLRRPPRLWRIWETQIKDLPQPFFHEHQNLTKLRNQPSPHFFHEKQIGAYINYCCLTS